MLSVEEWSLSIRWSLNCNILLNSWGCRTQHVGVFNYLLVSKSICSCYVVTFCLPQISRPHKQSSTINVIFDILLVGQFNRLKNLTFWRYFKKRVGRIFRLFCDNNGSTCCSVERLIETKRNYLKRIVNLNNKNTKKVNCSHICSYLVLVNQSSALSTKEMHRLTWI